MSRPGLMISICCLISIGQSYAQEFCIDKTYDEIISAEQQGFYLREQIFTAAPTNNYDILYHRINWHVSPDTLFISGSVFSLFELTENSTEIYFDLTDTLFVDSVIMHGELVDFEHNNHAIKIFLQSEIESGEIDSVEVFYHGKPAFNGFGSMGITEHESGNNLWTLSEPYGASDWWPCKQSITDKIDSLDIFITVPNGNRAGAPGLLIEEISAGGFTTYHWKTNYPTATYLVGISVSNFDVYSFYTAHQDDSVLFYNLIYPEMYEEGVTGINDIIPSFQLYVDKFGPYPFAEEKYGHMQFGWGGGMEHQTMSSVVKFTFDLLVHEMAHQWFGNKITCGTWEDIWLNEGFATYSNALCYYFIDEIHIYWSQWLKGTREEVTSLADGSVAVKDTSDVSQVFSSRLSYYKGAWLLHMLHYTLGEDEFFDGIYSYVNDPELAYDFVTTADLQSHLEFSSDTTLTEFFDDWLYGEGYPAYNLIWSQEENGTVTIALSQSPSHESVDFFEMNVPVRLKGVNDSVDLVLNHRAQGQLFIIQPEFEVIEIILDPDMWLLHANDAVVRVEINPDIAQVVIYPNPVNGILTIQHVSAISESYSIQIFNVSGQKVASMNFVATENSAQLKWDLSDLASGIYLLNISSESRSLVQKLVVI